MQKSDFYSHGKLLITGEYLVLDQAKALALPTKFGQHLNVKETDSQFSTWESYLSDGSLWYKFEFTINQICQTSYQPKNDFEERLSQIFKFIRSENSELFINEYNFKTHLEFPQNWGLGSSSTLINNLAKWSKINPYKLLENTFGGSGYDIAAAQSKTALFYTRNDFDPQVKTIQFPEFLKDHIYFIYLNQKQNSRDAIEHYRSISQAQKDKSLNEISQISEEVINVENLEHFEELMKQHEGILEKLLGQQKVQDKLFPDYKHGIVKSLGAWGGDFVLVTAKNKGQLSYFKNKAYHTILSYREMIL
ncbi:GYDIA family GHMP kinase [Psychroflexus halocasei]|uniref:Mevalonate kinase n=1 Tax=Psychroflexus halocasei TaxID=908615 RepID=A0A1H3W301_9FLAO|nr:GYDIA family GHMP kinase [Psychroflexus halocasei]SDZ81426.1 Mevalonate kinase [Psychroflexus halocasei]